MCSIASAAPLSANNGVWCAQGAASTKGRNPVLHRNLLQLENCLCLHLAPPSLLPFPHNRTKPPPPNTHTHEPWKMDVYLQRVINNLQLPPPHPTPKKGSACRQQSSKEQNIKVVKRLYSVIIRTVNDITRDQGYFVFIWNTYGLSFQERKLYAVCT